MIFVNMGTCCLPNSSQVQTKYEKRILSPILGTSIYLLTYYLFIYLFDNLFIYSILSCSTRSVGRKYLRGKTFSKRF